MGRWGKDRLPLTVEASSLNLPYGLDGSPVRSSENAGHPQHRVCLPAFLQQFPRSRRHFGSWGRRTTPPSIPGAAAPSCSAAPRGTSGRYCWRRAGTWPCSRLSPVPQSPGRPQPAAARAPGKVKSRGILFLPAGLRGSAPLSPSAFLGSFLRRAGPLCCAAAGSCARQRRFACRIRGERNRHRERSVKAAL